MSNITIDVKNDAMLGRMYDGVIATKLYSLEKALEKKDNEIERLNNIMNDIETYIHLWNIEDIGEKTMLILNDILLIKNGMSDEVIRLKGSDKE